MTHKSKRAYECLDASIILQHLVVLLWDVVIEVRDDTHIVVVQCISCWIVMPNLRSRAAHDAFNPRVHPKFTNDQKHLAKLLDLPRDMAGDVACAVTAITLGRVGVFAAARAVSVAIAATPSVVANVGSCSSRNRSPLGSAATP